MLVAIFTQLDSVSRKRAETVCSHWLALLRDTISLQKYVKLDRSVLPSFVGELYESVPPKQKLYQAVMRFVDGNLVVETLHITDESNPARPWSSAVGAVNRDDECFERQDLAKMSESLCHGIRHPDWTPRVFAPRLTCVILEKLVLAGSDLCVNGFFYARAASSLRSVELRKVKLCGVTWILLSEDAFTSDLADRESDWALERTIVSATLHYNCASCPTEPFVQLLNAADQNDGPLTFEEEERFRHTTETGEDAGLVKETQRSMKSIIESMAGRQLTLNDIKDGSTLTPFQKRLVLTEMDEIVWWDDADWEDEDDHEEDDE